MPSKYGMATPIISAETIMAARCQIARDDFSHFCRIVDIPGAPIDDDESMLLPTAFDRPMTKHHALLCQKLQAVEAGEIPRIMIFMPPGSAKSTYGSKLFPAWFIGRMRGRSVLCASYNSELATTMGEDTRSVVGQAIFESVFQPGRKDKVTLSDTTSAKDFWKLKNGNQYYAGGLMSGITGRRADLIIVDDPIKGQSDADSDAVRNKIWKEWEASVKTRSKPGCRYVIIQTRWHEDDLAGRILPEGYRGQSGQIMCRDGQVWEVVNIPAEAYLPDDPLGRADGDMLWPEYFTESHWAQFRNSGRTWNALFQQRPSGDEGLEFKAEWFQGGMVDGVELPQTMYQPGEQPNNLNIYMTSDHARRESARSDYNVFRIWGVDSKGQIWLLDSVRRKGDLLDAMGVTTALGVPQIADTPTNRGALALMKKWRPRKWFPEADPSWQSHEKMVRSYMRDFGIWCQIDEKSTRVKGSIGKVEKARPYIKMCEEGKVHLPMNSIGHDAIQEYIPFPAGAHDDQVDADAMMGRVIGEYQKALLPAEEKPLPMSGYKKVVQIDRHSQKGLY
jgi:phage terminase large subunit-like protein